MENEVLIEELRRLADLTPPICAYDRPEEDEIFGKKITVYCKPFEQFQDTLRQAADRIEELEAERRWISVEERLPEGETKVLALTKRRTRLIASYNHLFERWFAGGNIVVTHWMPLPEMPDAACRHLSVSLEADSSPQGEPGGTDCHSSCGASQ